MKKAILVLIVLLFSAMAHAEDNDVCGDKVSLAALWKAKYRYLIKHSPVELVAGTREYKIAGALCFLENTGIPDFVNFYDYFSMFVKEIVIESENRGRYAEADFTKLGVVRLFPDYFDESANMRYARASILIHEARHIELRTRFKASYELHNLGGSTYRHVICSHGESKGKQACDLSFTHNRWEDASPIVYEIMFLKNVHDRSQYRVNRLGLAYLINLLLDDYINTVSPEIRARYRIN